MNKIKSALLSTAVLGMAFLTNSAMADQQSDALVTKTPFDVSSKTFEVTAQQSVNGKAIKSIDVAVWSEENGQDDIKWYTTTKIGEGTYKVQINLGNHGYISGDYSVHIYGHNAISNNFEGLRVTSGFNAVNVPKPNATPSPRITTYINETNTYPVGQCTWAVKSLALWIPNWLGNAGGWAVNARAKGFRVGTTPRVGSIVVWPHDGNGYGHVAYVTAVSSNTRIQVKESNYAGKQYIANFRGWFNPLDSFWGGDVSYIYPD